MTLRELRWQDIDELVGLEREIFPEDAWDAAGWWSELAGRPRRDYVVDDVDGRVAAYGGLDHAGEVSDVMTLAVAPAARGEGRGRVLLEELVRRASGRGAVHLVLEVRADNGAARGLYEARGFRVVRTRTGYYRGGGDALVMRLALEEDTRA